MSRLVRDRQRQLETERRDFVLEVVLLLLVGPEEDLEDILFPQVAEVFLLGRG